MSNNALRPDPLRSRRTAADCAKTRETAINFNVEEIQPVTLSGPDAVTGRDHMSPYVWRQADGRLGIMVRAVPPLGGEQTDTGVVWYGTGDDGQRFHMTDEPVIAPGPGPDDIGGIEDPTVLRWHDDIVVYYTGVSADHSTGKMLYAVGPSATELYKKGVALDSTKTRGNTKEANVEQTEDGKWRLFYEYAHEQASWIGMAIGLGVAGPWKEVPTPLHPRQHSWDNWHLSTGPLLLDDPELPRDVLQRRDARRPLADRLGRPRPRVPARRGSWHRAAHHPAAGGRPHGDGHRLRRLRHHRGGRHHLALLLAGGPDAGTGADRTELKESRLLTCFRRGAAKSH